MTALPQIDVRDLGSVRRAAASAKSDDGGRVLLGDDWIAPDDNTAAADQAPGRVLRLRSSPLARKIITFNLVALIILVAGMMYLAPARDNLALQRANALVSEAELVADVFEIAIPADMPVDLLTGDGMNVRAVMEGIDLPGGTVLRVHDATGRLVATAVSDLTNAQEAQLDVRRSPTVLTDFLSSVWGLVASTAGRGEAQDHQDHDDILPPERLLARAIAGETASESFVDDMSHSVFLVATPILQGNRVVGVAALTSAMGEIDLLVRLERERLLQLFVIGTLVSVGLSLVLASTIANPLAELAAAAEAGRDRNARKMAPGRIRIPDLTARPDEIGRLSGAMRDMVAALYDRIEGNEQFAADVAHEIKNPLASLRSAVGTLRIAKREDQRDTLLDIIDQDVGRLDRLVSDISAASRLDSELVREEEEAFDLMKTVRNINEFLGREAEAKGVEYITDLPEGSLMVHGLEGRLAQVFVNIITNAISFCDEGDAIRVWSRKRENRVLVVVEDTGPGIPEEALTKIFQRFYSERPEGQFGNNSGLGLAISKQIVEAHGGVIWAENIGPTAADATSERLGARFVVGLPV
jgi:two-component system, OmpR family, sensor histidine kinase ChvG